jgi:hypothetical protein
VRGIVQALVMLAQLMVLFGAGLCAASPSTIADPVDHASVSVGASDSSGGSSLADDLDDDDDDDDDLMKCEVVRLHHQLVKSPLVVTEAPRLRSRSLEPLLRPPPALRA